MKKKTPFVFAAALLMAALLYQPFAAAQGGAGNVDASIDAILNRPAPAPQPVAAPAEAAVEAPAPVTVAVEAPVEVPTAEPVVEAVAAEAAPVVEAPAPILVVEAPAPAPVAVAPAPVLVVEAPAPVAEAPAPVLVVEAPVPAPVAEAPAASEEGEVLVSMEFDGAPLPDVIRAFREASGANIISGWTNSTTRLVSMRLDQVEWRLGLNAIVGSYGLELKEEPRDSAIYVVREKVKVESELPRYVETFVLKHSKAEEISSILQYSFGFSSPAVEATNKNAKAQSAAVTDPKSVTVAYPSGNIVIVKATEEQLKDCRSIIETLDVPKRQVYIEARFVRLNSSASKKLGMKWDMLAGWGVTLDNLKGGFEVNDGVIRSFPVRTSSEDNTIKSSGGLSRLNSEVTKTADASFSSTASSGHITMIPEEISPAPGANRTAESMTWKKASGFGGQLSVDSLRLALSAFEQMDGVQMFSNPKIIVENETTAIVDMTTKIPNIKVSIEDSTSQQGSSKLSSELEIIPGEKEPWAKEAFFSYGISMEVTPRVSPSGLITVEIVPSISSIDKSYMSTIKEDRITLPGYKVVGENEYPIITMQRLITTFTMADGMTAVIGGLTETIEENIDSGIPLLRHIPWIGPRIFGWKSRDKKQTEIIVFVTVGIVDGENIARDAGMPKNAVLGRGLLDGTIKEPGDRTDEEMFNLETKPKGYRIK